MPMGANGRRNTGSIRPAEWWRNSFKTAPKTQRLHQRLGHINQTLHADIEKPTSLKKTLIIYTKYIFVFMKKKLNFVEKICIWLLAQHSTVIHNKQYTTQQKQYTTQNCYIISFEKMFGRFWRGGLFELDWFKDRRQLNSLLTATEDGC